MDSLVKVCHYLSNIFSPVLYFLDIDECEFDPCDTNAFCNDTSGSFICTCDYGYFGDGFDCERKSSIVNRLLNVYLNSVYILSVVDPGEVLWLLKNPLKQIKQTNIHTTQIKRIRMLQGCGKACMFNCASCPFSPREPSDKCLGHVLSSIAPHTLKVFSSL